MPSHTTPTSGLLRSHSVAVPSGLPNAGSGYSPRDPDALLSRRTELVLRELDSLPTLPSVAAKLIELGSREDVEVREIVRLIEVDPSLTAKLLSLCRKAATRTRYPITTVEMAVVMLGLDAVRSLVLSVQIFDWAAQTPRRTRSQGPSRAGARRASAPGTPRPDAPSKGFDRVGFWQHAIAVACCADLIAREHPELNLQPEEAFVCGLVHDLGKLALDLVLPKAYARVIELSELREGNIADFERPIVGLDHHTAGLRLAERWNLPNLLREAMSLHALSAEDLANSDCQHKDAVALVAVADALCRRLSLGWSGNHAATDDSRLREIAHVGGLVFERIENVLPRIYEATSVRCKDLGLGDEPSQQLLVESILRANARLGRLNHELSQANRSLEDAQKSLTEARAMASLGEMTSGAAHEMNTPLAVISGRAQTLLKNADTESQRAGAQAIIDAAHKISTMIHRLNRIASPPAPAFGPTDVKAMLEQVIARAKAKAQAREDESRASTPRSSKAPSISTLGVKLTIPDGLGPARLDRELFADAIVEIVVNALESSPKTVVEVRAEPLDDGRLLIEIADDGRGMSEHALAHAVDPFFSEKPAGRQSGLGLALAHRILQTHGASLTLTSRPGRGTTASVWLDRWRWSAHERAA